MLTGVIDPAGSAAAQPSQGMVMLCEVPGLSVEGSVDGGLKNWYYNRYRAPTCAVQPKLIVPSYVPAGLCRVFVLCFFVFECYMMCLKSACPQCLVRAEGAVINHCMWETMKCLCSKEV